jgi:hypothetical protein
MGRKSKPAGDPPPTPPATDREKYRKFHKPVRIRGHFVVIAEVSAAELGHDLTQWVNDAVRMRLASEGRWPPKA